jgi:iron complex transport system substrate-binding protein
MSPAVAQSPAPQRIVSLVPSVTEILFAIGAGRQIVGIGSFDTIPDEFQDSHGISRVGGLLDPDMERIFTLRPDLVILYESQTDPQEQLRRAGIPVLPYQHGSLAEISETIRDLGQRMEHPVEANAVATKLEARLAEIRDRVAGRRRPRTLLVFAREPLAMRNVYVSGGIGFLHDMLDAAGGENVFAAIQRERVAQVSSEAILTSAPDVIIEIRYEDSLSQSTLDRERAVYGQLSTLPAVRTGRIHFLMGNRFVVPGPGVAEATAELARLLHPEAF